MSVEVAIAAGAGIGALGVVFATADESASRDTVRLDGVEIRVSTAHVGREPSDARP